MIQEPKNESVIDTIHRIRREIAERFSHDVESISTDADARAKSSGRPIWKRADHSVTSAKPRDK